MTATGRSIAALLLNALVWPGLGSIVGGASVGWTQGTLFLLLSLLLFAPLQQGGDVSGGTIFVLASSIAVWGWSIATGIRLVREGRLVVNDPARASSAPP